MEHIPGLTLQEYERDFPWSLDQWWVFAQDLLNAVEKLEEKQLFHRDIKPANIILHEEDNHPVLIDFGFALKQNGTGKVRFAERHYIASRSSYCIAISADGDRYAAGVVLFKVLTGYLPFDLENGQQRNLRIPVGLTDEKVRRIASVLLRVVSNDPVERPESVAQMRQELQNALLAVVEPVEAQPLLPQINPWVEHVRGLYRNSNTGNADNRGLDTPFVRETYVPTALDKHLLPAIFRLSSKNRLSHRKPRRWQDCFFRAGAAGIMGKGCYTEGYTR